MIVLFPVFLILGLVLSVWGAYFISTKIYNSLVKNENKNAVLVRVLSFTASFFIIAAVLFFLLIANIRIER